MTTKDNFGHYIWRLRENREMTVREVEAKLDQLFPNQKHYQISQAYIIRLEKGDLPAPSPMKIRGLSKVYGENYEFMLYKAGYLDRNPLGEDKEKNWQEVRELYLDHFTKSRNFKPLTEEEKQSVEKVLASFLEHLNPK